MISHNQHLHRIDHFKPSDNYMHRLIYLSVNVYFVFKSCIILGVNNDYFLKQN
jgi:hypothetical protein